MGHHAQQFEDAQALYVSMQGCVYAAPNQHHPQQQPTLWLAVQQQQQCLFLP